MPQDSSNEPSTTHKGANANFPSTTTSDPEAVRSFALDIARLLSDDKCQDVLVLDVRELSQVSDYLVIATGTSDRQIRSVIQHVLDLGEERGNPAFGSLKDESCTWVIADFVDIVVHLFEPNTRAFYDLEMLWGDAPRLVWEREGDPSRNRAGLSRDDVLPEDRAR
jgi:ribosome-associated protein